MCTCGASARPGAGASIQTKLALCWHRGSRWLLAGSGSTKTRDAVRRVFRRRSSREGVLGKWHQRELLQLHGSEISIGDCDCHCRNYPWLRWRPRSPPGADSPGRDVGFLWCPEVGGGWPVVPLPWGMDSGVPPSWMVVTADALWEGSCKTSVPS